MVFGLCRWRTRLGALPLAWFGGYRLERRYGLSHQDRGGWLGDHLKAAGVGLLLASARAARRLSVHAVVSGVVVAGRPVSRWPLWSSAWRRWRLWCCCPLFFRFTPLARPSLVDRLEQLASRAGTSVVGVYEWALGDKSRRANAALTGLGSTRRILVSDTMLADYSDEEIEVVLAHELGHHVHHDIWRGIALESALILLGLGVTDVVLRWSGRAWACRRLPTWPGCRCSC